MPFNIGGYIYNPTEAKVQDYQNIITRGLVLHMDASTPESYPGSGTTWADLSPSVTNATLTNGPTYSTDGSGSIVFDGSNDYGDIGDVSSLQFERTNAFSINTWIKHTYTGANGNIISKQLNSSPYTGWGLSTTSRSSVLYLEFFIYNGSVANNSVIVDYPSIYNDGTWMNICCTYNGNSSYTGVNIYRNGASVSPTVITTSIGITINSSASVQLSGRGGTGAIWPGSMGNAMIYNRELSAAEVAQNYNIQRNRFGL